MSMFSRITGKPSNGPVKGLAAAFGLPQKKAQSPVRGRGRSRSHYRSRSRSRSASGSSRSQSYSDDDDHSASPNRSTRSSGSRSRSRSRSQSRERQRPSSAAPAAKKNRMVGVANPRAEAKAAQEKLEAAKRKKAEVAAQARSIRANMSSTTGRQASPAAKKRPSTASSSQKLSGTQPTSTFRQRAGSPPARPATNVTIPALPPCTCTSVACREEFRLVYNTLQAHLSAQATATAAYAEIQRENAFLRKQLQLYRISGEARTYHETTLGMTAGTAALERAELARSASGMGFSRTASLSSPTNASSPNGGSVEDEEAARRRRMKERERERERRMEEAKQNVLERDGGEETPYESRAGTSAFPFAPSSASSAPDVSSENRFTLPASPSSRLRPFGGAGSERLDVNASPSNLASSLGRSGSIGGLTRQPSNSGSSSSGGGAGNPGLTRQPSGGASGPGLTRQPSNGPGLTRQPSGRERLQRTDEYEADDLVADLNRPISVQGDRRNGEPMAGTQEFDIAYA